MGIKGKLSHLKKSEQVESKKLFASTVVVGQSPYAAALVAAMLQGQHDILWITDKEVTLHSMLVNTPTTIRGSKNIEIFSSLSTNDSAVQVESYFYKDMKFRKFGGRSKSMELLVGESFYVQDGVKVVEDLVSSTRFNSCLRVNHITHIESIKKIETTDLVKQQQWCLITASNEEIECCNLVWAKDPLLFYKLISCEKFSEIPNFLQESITLARLYISFTISQRVFEEGKTYFIPLSYSTAEGHFIGEGIESENQQKLNFVHYFDDLEHNEDDVIKKIKNLKRQLKKIFSLDRENDLSDEYYALTKIEFVEKYFDDAVTSLFTDFPTLFWLGENAPLLEGDETISHYVRAKLSLNFVQQKLVGDTLHSNMS